MARRKRKLTLTVDAETVETAKRLGVNISEVTERVLRNFAFDSNDESRKTLLSRYKAMFESMQPLIREYDTSVHVGRVHFVSQGSNPNTLLISYRRRTDDWRIAYYLQTSTSFADWQTMDPSLIVNEVSSALSPSVEWLTQEVMVTDSVPQFFRVKVLFLVPE